MTFPSRRGLQGLELAIQRLRAGCGIAKEALERIFKPFEQEQSSSGDSRNFQGMGLGLAVVQEIASMHSAQIRVEPFGQVKET